MPKGFGFQWHETIRHASTEQLVIFHWVTRFFTFAAVLEESILCLWCDLEANWVGQNSSRFEDKASSWQGFQEWFNNFETYPKVDTTKVRKGVYLKILDWSRCSMVMGQQANTKTGNLLLGFAQQDTFAFRALWGPFRHRNVWYHECRHPRSCSRSFWSSPKGSGEIYAACANLCLG